MNYELFCFKLLIIKYLQKGEEPISNGTHFFDSNTKLIGKYFAY